MKKEDIIKQKLFETCKLSEFYLDLIVNCNDNYDESEFLLSKAYSKKLYEIVARYDRLLELNEIEQRQLNERLTSSMDDALTISQTNNPCSTMNNSLLYDSDDDEDEYENEYNYYKYVTKQHYVDTPNTSNGEIEEEEEDVEEEEEEVDVDEEIDEPKQRQMIEKSLSNLSKDSGISILNDHNYYANDCCSNNSTTSSTNNSSTNNNHNNNHGTHNMLRKLNENDYSNETSLSGSIYESRQAIDGEEFDSGSSNNNDNLNNLTLFDDNDKLQDSTYNLYTPPLRRSSVASDLLTDSNCGLIKSSISNRNRNSDDNDNNNNKQMLTSTAKRNRFIHVQSMDSLNETLDSIVNQQQQDYKLNDLSNSEIVYQSSESPPIFNKSNLMDVSMIENIEATNRSTTDYDYMNSSILFFK